MYLFPHACVAQPFGRQVRHTGEDYLARRPRNRGLAPRTFRANVSA